MQPERKKQKRKPKRKLPLPYQRMLRKTGKKSKMMKGMNGNDWEEMGDEGLDEDEEKEWTATAFKGGWQLDWLHLRGAFIHSRIYAIFPFLWEHGKECSYVESHRFVLSCASVSPNIGGKQSRTCASLFNSETQKLSCLANFQVR